jgi:hypothetical protein
MDSWRGCSSILPGFQMTPIANQTGSSMSRHQRMKSSEVALNYSEYIVQIVEFNIMHTLEDAKYVLPHAE